MIAITIFETLLLIVTPKSECLATSLLISRNLSFKSYTLLQDLHTLFNSVALQ